MLEGSGKWPDEVEAIRRLKAAYYLSLSKALSKVARNLLTAVYTDHLDVYKASSLHFNIFLKSTALQSVHNLTAPPTMTHPLFTANHSSVSHSSTHTDPPLFHSQSQLSISLLLPR